MFDLGFLLSPEVRPFSVAGGIGLGLCLIEIVSFLAGASLSEVIDGFLEGPDGDAEIEGEGIVSSIFGFLNPDRVPIAMWSILALLIFGGIGLFGQSALAGIGMALPAWPAAAAALLPAVPAVRVASRGLALVLPKDETEAVSGSDLVGRVASVTFGPVTADSPGGARLRDQFDTLHNVRVVPLDQDARFDTGELVLLVDLGADNLFRVARAPSDLIATARTS